MVADTVDEVDQGNDMSNLEAAQLTSMMKTTCSISHKISISHSHSASISAPNSKPQEQLQQSQQTLNEKNINTNSSTISKTTVTTLKSTNSKTLGKTNDSYNDKESPEEFQDRSSALSVVTSKKQIKTQLKESFSKSRIVVAACDTILQRIANRYNWHDDTPELIHSFLTSKTFGIIYFSLFWMRVVIWGLLGKSSIIGLILVLLYYCCQLSVMTILNCRFLLFNIRKFEAVYKCVNSIIFTTHFYLLESPSIFDIQSVLFIVTLTCDTFFVINAPCLRASDKCKIFSLFLMISMCGYGYAMAYYLINLNYYAFAWAGLNDGWTKDFRDFEYNVFGSTISTRFMVMSSATNLMIFFAKQMFEQVKFPNSVMYLTPYKIHYRREDNINRGD